MSPACPLSKRKLVSSFGKEKETRDAHMSRIDEQFKISAGKRLFIKDSITSYKSNNNILNS